ncbi:protein phosphatase 2C domain-containing protein [Mycobacterium hubeiense]|uniref:protein phosphatase 2C domain-containing protein n=1 Tax=Mycobacterium hubeiense TaxID=1867256 RepID=UPI000C7F4786|nr:protein phosphatase 2C domain-containing protein [Mycobacterium sp. QGD 101]
MLVAVDDLLTIGEFAARSGLSAKMLRTYAAAGVLTPVAVDQVSGYRYYSEAQLGQAKVIAQLRRAQIPVADIAAFLRHPTDEQIDAWRTQLDDEIDVRRHALETARRALAEDERATMVRTLKALAAANRTDQGVVRDINQDAVLAAGMLYAVADGFGALGDKASRLALDMLGSEFAAQPNRKGLVQAVQRANETVWQQVSANTDDASMGTTLTALAMLPADDGGPVVVNIGDSRLYRIRGDRMDQLTEDHTVVANMLRSGALTSDQARSHPRRHLLTRALGLGPATTPDIVDVDCRADDRLLLCTDGLYAALEASDIMATATSAEPETAARQLINMANSAGGADNVTVVVIDVG